MSSHGNSAVVVAAYSQMFDEEAPASSASSSTHYLDKSAQNQKRPECGFVGLVNQYGFALFVTLV